MGTKKTFTREQVDALPWWHSIELAPGLVTPGGKTSKLLAKEADLVFRDSVSGKTVLDIGAWDGFFSFEAKRRGANRVVAMEWDAWIGRHHGNRGSFELARDALGLDIEDVTLDVGNLTTNSIGCFDVVLFLGVLYHLKDPFGAIERVASVTKERLILETHLDAQSVRLPVMRFHPGDSLSSDPSNWWSPNIRCVREMLSECGFRKIDAKKHPMHRDRGFFYAFR